MEQVPEDNEKYDQDVDHEEVEPTDSPQPVDVEEVKEEIPEPSTIPEGKTNQPDQGAPSE